MHRIDRRCRCKAAPLTGARGAWVTLWAWVAGSLLLAACATSGERVAPAVGSISPPPRLQSVAAVSAPDELTVMTMNIAHARRDGFHQLLQSTSTAIDNLNAIGALLHQQAADIVALQEADGPSFWSGNFDHVAYLAETGAFAQHVRGDHVRGPRLAYGTALLSAQELRDPLTVRFQPGLSPLPKGFVVCAIQWPGGAGLQVDVVSVHLDPFNPSLRRKQAAELIDTVRARGLPVILMGDFNTDWQEQGSVLRMIVETLRLKAYQPHNARLHTFPALAKRLDWILISEHFEFLSHEILPAGLSDHRGVSARLGLAARFPGAL
jgi:endonuclease/exonuclease/phosphatase family metal-dependent hydrolase